MELVWTCSGLTFFIISSVSSFQMSISNSIQACESVSQGKQWEFSGPQNPPFMTGLRNASEFCHKPSRTFLVNTQEVNFSIEFAHFQAKTENDVIRSHMDGNGTFTFYAPGAQMFPVQSYCISKKNSSWTEVKICCSKSSPCFRKCCPEGEGYDYFDQACKPFPSLASASWRFKNQRRLPRSMGLPHCLEDSLLPFSTALSKPSNSNYSLPYSPYRILDNGDVEYLHEGEHWVKKSDNDDYCVDQLAMSAVDLDFTCPLEQDILIMCLTEKPTIPSAEPEPENFVLQVLYLTSILLAMACLLATAFVLLHRKDQQNIHVWTILFYVMCQFLFYTFVVLIRLKGVINVNIIPESWCSIVGVVGHFFGLSTFSWLSVINFDLWWTFRVLQPIDQKKLYSKRFGWYLVFSVCLPLVIISTSVAMHLQQQDVVCGSTSNPSVVYPEYGKFLCFLSREAQLYYFYIPIGILLFINFAFYIITTYKILNMYNRSQRINSQKHRQSCQLFLKLFLVMGTLWIFQVIHAFIDSTDKKWYWVLLDMVNIFQAFAVFIIFVCNRPTQQVCSGSHGFWRCFYCCIGYKPNLYRKPTLTDRSTDGSTRISRADNVKSVVGVPDRPEPEEIIQLS